ncbi:MYXO-CTERM sorting domain-containing protein, partial [Leifsonia sp. 2TAF2]|uniref:MYXO-CTERM sorting domain-containing protein n=1 Tax=Leifsonia sp. 2TAF2 TaxID=3233009 RepID=UPI003F958F03
TLNLPDVVNKQLPVPVIPLTGGLGTDALTFAGGGLLASVLALAGWQLLRRRRTAGMPEGS